MAERKRVKGKKPTESMRQRQQRLLREQRAAKAKARTVKTNPTGAPRGAQGPRTAPVQGPSRRTPSTMGGDTGRRIPQNKYGTAGTPRSGPPGLGKPPRFNPSIRTPARTPGGAAGLAIATGAALGEAYRRTDRAKAESARGEGRRTFSAQKPPQKPFSKPPKTESKPGVQGRNTRGGQGGSRASVTRKPGSRPTVTGPNRTQRRTGGRPNNRTQPVQPARRGMSNIPPKEGTGMGSPNDKKRQNVTPKAPVKPKVKAKAKPQTTGVGPVASGRAYSVAKTGKSVSQQRAAELRAMRERSKKRQAEMKKKKKK